ncbi:beta strand repeat-containing protein [Prosthecobacter sp.]|uniref:beta strand repeat-containing protein n=1 Tax=Prosthecobacter sp. TaxID=1965333 RepID=UPI0037835B25
MNHFPLPHTNSVSHHDVSLLDHTARLRARAPSAFSCALSVVLLLLALHGGRSFATSTWVGNTSADMGVAANWGGTLPTLAGDSLVFNAAGTGGSTLNNTITGQVLTSGGITFNSGASAFTLNGNAVTVGSTVNVLFTNNSSNLQTINLPLNLAFDVLFAGTSSMTIGGAIGQGGTSGARTINNNMTSGTLTISGTISMTSSSTARAWTLSGNSSTSTIVTGVFQNGSSGAGSLVLYTTNSAGGAVLSGANTYTGSTTVSFGTLGLDFSAAAITDNIINNTSSSSALVMGGGTLTITGKSGATNTQRFNGTSFSGGRASALRITQNGASSVGVTLGAITRSTGSSVDFTLPTSGSITTSTTAAAIGANNVLALGSVAFGTVGGTTWATNASGTIGALAAGSYQTSFTSTTGDTDVTSSLSPAAFTTNTLRFNAAGTTLTLSSSASSVVTSGGILVTAVGAGSSIAGGGTSVGLTVGAGKELVIFNNTTGTSGFTISAPIIDNATSALTVSGPGITKLTGANTYAGTTSITGGVLDVGTLSGTAGLSIGNGGIILAGGGVLQANGSFTRGFSNAATVSGGDFTGLEGGFAARGGALTINFGGGGAAMTLGISSTNYRLGNNFVFGSPTADSPVIVINPLNLNGATNGLGRTFTVNSGVGGDYAELQGVLSSSAGALIKAGTGLLVLSAANTYTGSTTINAGTLQLGNISTNGGTTGSLDSTSAIFNNGTLAFNRADSGLTISAVISGTGTVNQIGAGTTTLSASNSYTGVTTISAGTLQLGTGAGGSTTGSIASSSSIVNNATLTFNRSNSSTLGVVISGTGAVNVIGSGTIILTSSNTYTGVTTISAGTLQLGSGTGGSSAGSIVGTGGIVNNATLTFNRSNTPTYSGAISGTGVVNFIGNGTVTLTGASTYTGVTTISAGGLQLGSGTGGGSSGSIDGTSSITNNATLSFNRSNTLTMAAAITGTGVVNQIGAGITNLSGANTYGGGTNVNAGTLTFLNTSAKPASGTTTVAAGATLGLGVATSGSFFTSADVDSLFAGTMTNVSISTTSNVGIDTTAGNFTYASSVSGTRGLTKLGANTLTLTGTNTYTGVTTIAGGVLDVGTISGGALSGSGLVFANDGILQGNGTFTRNFSGSATAAAGQIAGPSGGFAARGGTLMVNFGGAGATITISNGSVRFGTNFDFGSPTADSKVIVVNPLDLNTLSRTFTVTSGLGGDSAELQGAISSSSSTDGIIKAGTGLLILSATNSYTGATVINAGTLQLGSGTGGGAAGAINSTSGVTNNGTLAYNRSGSTSPAYSITGTGIVNQIGNGTTTLSGANSYTGGTNVNAGTLTFLNTNARPSTGVVTVASGATLGLGVATSGSFFTSADVDSLFAGAMVNVTNSATSNVGIDTTAGNFTYASSVSGTRGLTKLGAGILTLTGTNTYIGTTTISGGVVDVGNVSSGALASSGLVFTNDGVLQGNGTFTRSFSGATSATAGAGQIAGTSGGFAARGGTLTINFGGSGASVLLSNSNFRFGTNFDFGSATADSKVIVVNPLDLNTVNRTFTVISGVGGDSAELQGAITGGAFGITKAGNGLLILSGTSTYTAATNINAGTLQLGNGGATGSLSSSTAVVNNATLAISRSNAYTVANSISGTGNVTQIGTGATTLTAANTYSGGTSVISGTLIAANASGSATGTGSVTTSPGTTLGGAGIIAPTASSSVVIGGTLAPGFTGSSVGTLTFTPVDGSVTMQSGSSITFELSANHTNDKIVFAASGAGVFDLSAMSDGSVSVTFAGGYTPALNDSFDLLDWSALSGSGISGLTASLLNLSTAGFDPSWTWDTTQFTTTGVVTVVAAVPEPCRILLLACGFIGIILRRRRTAQVFRA